jgi:hypothetical protein
MRLDPLSLPMRFDTRDPRADGGVRQVEIRNNQVILRRAVQGIRMAINVRVDEFRGLAVRQADESQMLVLVHHDPSLSIPLLFSTDSDEILHASFTWSDMFALPLIEEDGSCNRPPAPRRRRHHVIKTRRPKIHMRRHNGKMLSEMLVHRNEHEMISRN